jgi:hypothetical protein
MDLDSRGSVFFKKYPHYAIYNLYTPVPKLDGLPRGHWFVVLNVNGGTIELLGRIW